MRIVGFYNHKGKFKTPAGFASWLAYWEYRTGRKASTCMNIDCKNGSRVDLVGAHVDVPGEEGIYLIPLCKDCNHYTNEGMMRGYEVNFVLVPKELLIPEV